ncbi:NAD-dependent epimerase/dehydratase family protein [Thalassospira lucentensis]|uniref:NAD-dependent epimerase/dehydratase family protein n=1 Tax=Thalassospira lucentensis TaxID=168935 RepID=UPI0003B7B345|nr:NAD(P)-dependent oxidoreductase [Thalassospira lucentensis]RCK21227.1 hypothetical protein TH1_19175 [Thalassospira lucentensis MCCC 1A00383 = DSM 14000]
MKVLVTGASGLIGPHACAALTSAGHDVITCSRSELNAKASHHIVGDLLDSEFRKKVIRTEQPDGLLHLAWQTTHGHFWNAKDNPNWRDASIDLLNRFHDHGGKRATIAGSCAEYDWQNCTEKLGESANCLPATLYGQEKLRLAHHCLDLNTQGASIAWGRLFLLCGPHENPGRFVPAITNALLDDQSAKMSSGNQVRDFMHVADAGEAFAQVFEHNDFKGIVNIASGEGHSLLSVANLLRTIIGRGGLAPGSMPDRPDDPPFLVADTTLLKQKIGFRPKYDLKAALETCVDWWQAHEI